jgi:hypothetical protein
MVADMSGYRQKRVKSVSDSIAEAQQTIERARQCRERISETIAVIGKTGFAFLITHSELGIMFARIASQAIEGSNTRTRSQANARRAYDAVSRFIHCGSLSDRQREDVDGRMAQLKSALELLGEVFL